MKNVFRKETIFRTIKLIQCFIFNVANSRMSYQHGEGEKEIGNQGRSGLHSFSQETGVTNGQQPRNGANRLVLKRSKCRMHADTLTQLPTFFSLKAENV